MFCLLNLVCTGLLGGLNFWNVLLSDESLQTVCERYQNAKIPRCLNTKMTKYQDAKNQDDKMPKYQDDKLPRWQNTIMPKYQGDFVAYGPSLSIYTKYVHFLLAYQSIEVLMCK